MIALYGQEPSSTPFDASRFLEAFDSLEQCACHEQSCKHVLKPPSKPHGQLKMYPMFEHKVRKAPPAKRLQQTAMALKLGLPTSLECYAPPQHPMSTAAPQLGAEEKMVT